MSVFFELVGTNMVTIIKIRKAKYLIIRYSAFLKSGATRNRHFDLSGCISYRYIFKKEVISRYCSTKLLHCFAAKFFTSHFLPQR